MTKIIDFALSKAKTIIVIAVLVLLAGSYARQEIQVSSSPNIQLPFISVSVFLEGASPEDGSRLIARPLENNLRSVQGVKNISSYSTLGITRMIVEFEIAHDMNDALIDIQQSIEEVKSELPLGAEDPQIQEYSERSFPAMTISLQGEGSLRQKIYFAEEMKDMLESIDGIYEANLVAAPDEVLEGVIDKSKMEAYGVTLDDLYNSINNNNIVIPGGRQDTGLGSFNVEVPSVLETPSDVYSIPVKVTKDAVVTFGDIATVKRTFKDFNEYARINGKDTVALDIFLRDGANALDTKDSITLVLNDLKQKLPPNLDILITDDETVITEQMVSELEGNILGAILLIMVVVVASMGLRVGLLVGLSIPFCFLFTFIVLISFGYELNFLVMFGLLLSMGMLIDGSIVVTEYADRKISEGLTRFEAYRLGSKRMFYPILASTGTTLAAFIPLIFWPGYTGQFMKYLPMTVFFVLVASFFYAMIVTPVIGTYFGQHKSVLSSKDSVDKTGQFIFDNISEFYSKKIKFFIKNPVETMIACISIVAVIVTTYNFYGKGTEYFATIDPLEAKISIRGRGNFSALEKKEIIESIEERLLEIDELKNIYLKAGSDWFDSGSDKIGSGFVEVVPPSERTISGLEAIGLISKVTRDIPGVVVEAEPDMGGPQFGAPIMLGIYGDSEDTVTVAATEIENYMRYEVNGLTNIFSSRAYPAVEWSVEVDNQKAAQLGVSVFNVGALVQMLTSGFKVGEFTPDDSKDAIEIRARFQPEDRTITGINNLKVQTSNGLVPVSSFISLEPQQYKENVSRRNGYFYHEIYASNVPGVLVSDKVKELENWLSNQYSDGNIKYGFQGQTEETEEVNEFLVVAGGTAIFVMLLMLLTQFNSFYQSLLIMSSVVMSFVGVLLGLLITNKPFSSTMTGISIVTLAGIVVNNNIVLIDTFNRLKSDMPHEEITKIIKITCMQRLRPILLTTTTTILGLLPLALGLSVDIVGRDISVGSRVVDWWSNLAQSIVFGLGFSTLLTLIFTPAALAIPPKIKKFLEKREQLQINPQ
jgi:multidrug efflux pump